MNIENSGNRQPLLSINKLSKSFGGIQALKDINCDISDREILALLGDNGAGKSTLIKIVAGAYSLDSGEIFFEGKKIKIDNPDTADKFGIKTVHQHLALFGQLDVTANLFAGQEYSFCGVLRKKKMYNKARKVLDQLKTTIKSLKQKVSLLSGGQQHAIAIGRKVYLGRRPKLLIMDEPTAGLGVEESKEVLSLLKKLGQDISVIFITHNLDYAFEIADRALVLHSGQVAGEVEISQSSKDEIVKLMMGVERMN